MTRTFRFKNFPNLILDKKIMIFNNNESFFLLEILIPSTVLISGKNYMIIFLDFVVFTALILIFSPKIVTQCQFWAISMYFEHPFPVLYPFKYYRWYFASLSSNYLNNSFDCVGLSSLDGLTSLSQMLFISGLTERHKLPRWN